jgi:hypothetical protein
MIELAFVACLAGSPSTCEDHGLRYADVSLMACVMQAQAQLAAWTEHNPGWDIQRWTCRTYVSGQAEA